MRTCSAAFLAAILLLLVPFSSPGFAAGVSAFGSVEGRACNLDSDIFFRAFGSPDVTDGANGECGSVFGDVSGFADFGRLGGTAAVSATGRGRGGISAFDLEWFDAFTVTSASLPVGTPVEVRLGLFLDFSFSPSGGLGDQGRAVATLGAGRDDLFFIVSDHFIEQGNSGSFEHVAVLSRRVGETFPLVGRLRGAVGMTGNPGEIVVDASNTALSTVDVLTPGASYTTESGHSYVTAPTAAPAPPALLLLGAGLVGVAFTRKRRSARSARRP